MTTELPHFNFIHVSCCTTRIKPAFFRWAGVIFPTQLNSPLDFYVNYLLGLIHKLKLPNTMKYVIGYNKLTQGTSPSVSNYNVKQILIYKVRLRFNMYLTLLINNKIISLHILLWNLLTRQNFPIYSVKHKLLQLIFISQSYSSSKSAPRN